MTNLIKITNQGPGNVVLGEEFPGSKPLVEIRPGQATIVKLGTTIRTESPDSKIKVEELN